MTEPEPHSHIVIRACDASGLNELGGAIAPQTIRRDVTFLTRTREHPDTTDHTMAGLVIIGNDNLEHVARVIGQIILKIMATPELLWMPVNARREFAAWTIECVPLVDYLRFTSRTDDQLCRACHIDPTTGQPIGQEPPL